MKKWHFLLGGSAFLVYLKRDRLRKAYIRFRLRKAVAALANLHGLNEEETQNFIDAVMASDKAVDR